MNAPRSSRILIVDDDLDRARALQRILCQAGHEVHMVATAAEGLAAAPGLAPDLLLVDLILPDGSGLEVCRRLKWNPALRSTPIVLVSSILVTSEAQAEGLEAGADGYLSWPISIREFQARVALALRSVVRPPADAADRPDRVLSPRQREVAAFIAAGLTTKEIAHRLGISLRTAETHRAAIMRRLEFHSTADLVRYAIEHGLIRIGS